jgi:hypothetical protein
MIAIGCLLPFVLMIAGALLGAAYGGTHAGMIGLVAGLVLGIAGAIGMIWAFARAENR